MSYYYYLVGLIDESISNKLGKVLDDFEEDELKKSVEYRNKFIIDEALDLEHLELHYCEQCHHFSLFSADSMNVRCLTCERF